MVTPNRRFRSPLRRVTVVLFAGVLAFAGLATTGAWATDVPGTVSLRNVSQLVVTSAASTVAVNQTATVTATVSAPATGQPPATGSVVFLDDGALLGTGTLDANGVATFTGSFSVGAHHITAVYAGDALYQAVTSPAFTLTGVAPAPVVSTSVDGTASLGDADTDGQPNNVAIQVTAGPNDGTYANTRFNLRFAGIPGLNPGDLTLRLMDNGIWTDVPLTADTNGDIVAVLGDADGDPIMANSTNNWQLQLLVHPGSPTGTLTLTTTLVSSSDGGTTFPHILSVHSQNIDVSRADTTTTVQVDSVSTSTTQAPVPMRAFVTPANATGTVTFTDNGTVIGAAPLLNGIAGLSPLLGVGTHVIAASYSGDGTYGTSSGTSPTVISVASPGGSLRPITPARILDTRRGLGSPVASIPAGGTLTLQVTGRGNIPASGVTSVVMNLDVTTATKAGALTAYATGSPVPYVASLNFDANRMTSGMAMVEVSSDGKVSLLNRSAGPINLIVDTFAWFATPLDSQGPEGRYNGIRPFRLFDGTMAPNQTTNIKATGRSSPTGSVPATGVSAVMLNVTVTNPSTGGYINVYPTAGQRPGVSSVTFVKGLTRANRVIVGVGQGGNISVFNSQTATTGVSVDVVGWFTDATSTAGGATYVPLAVPFRLSSSFVGGTGKNAVLGTRGILTDPVAGVGAVPTVNSLTPPTAVAINLQASRPTATGYLSAWPSGVRPPFGDVQFAAGKNVGNADLVALYRGGFNVFNLTGNTFVTVDIFGWFG